MPETEVASASPATASAGRSKVLGAIQWSLTALGAVAATALGKVALDQINDGDYGGGRWGQAILFAAAFAVGVVALVSAVVATTTATSVDFSWLRNAKEPKGLGRAWRWVNRVFVGRDPYLAWEIASALTSSRYLAPGATSAGSPMDILASFSDKLTALVDEQYQCPSTFLQSEDKVNQLEILTAARDNLKRAARQTRLRQLSRQMPSRFLVGSLLAVIGTVGFALVTNEAKQVATERDERRQRRQQLVVTGDLLPKVPTTVRVLFPATLAKRDEQQKTLSTDGAKSCDLSTVDGVLVAVASPPASSGTADVMHVFTFATPSCKAVDLWLPAERVILPPPQPTPSSSTSSSSTSTTTAKARSTG